MTTREKVLELKAEGMSLSAIARQLKISRQRAHQAFHSSGANYVRKHFSNVLEYDRHKYHRRGGGRWLPCKYCEKEGR